MTTPEDMELIWELKIHGSTLVFSRAEDVLSTLESDLDIEEFQAGDKAVITKRLISRKAYEALPEFEGY